MNGQLGTLLSSTQSGLYKVCDRDVYFVAQRRVSDVIQFKAETRRHQYIRILEV